MSWKSRGTDGDFRNAHLLLRAAESLRRSVETAAKLQETMYDHLEAERFHDLILEEVALESPNCAQRIVARLQDLNTTWRVRLDAERRGPAK